MKLKPLEPIHYIVIMVCIISVALTFDYHTVQDNKRLELHKKCMIEHNFDYTDEYCELCDSLIKIK